MMRAAFTWAIVCCVVVVGAISLGWFALWGGAPEWARVAHMIVHMLALIAVVLVLTGKADFD